MMFEYEAAIMACLHLVHNCRAFVDVLHYRVVGCCNNLSVCVSLIVIIDCVMQLMWHAFLLF